MILGSYSITGDVFNIGVMLLFGVVGYFLRKAGVPLAPAALTIVLGSLMENSLRQSLSISQGSLSVFTDSPIATTLLSLAVLGLLLPGIKVIRRRSAAHRADKVSAS